MSDLQVLTGNFEGNIGELFIIIIGPDHDTSMEPANMDMAIFDLTASLGARLNHLQRIRNELCIRAMAWQYGARSMPQHLQ